MERKTVLTQSVRTRKDLTEEKGEEARQAALCEAAMQPGKKSVRGMSWMRDKSTRNVHPY